MSLNSMSLIDLKSIASTYGIVSPNGHNGYKKSWIDSIIKAKAKAKANSKAKAKANANANAPKYKQYSAYGKYSNNVEKMVNNNNIQICTDFFCNKSTLVEPFNINVYDIIYKYNSDPTATIIVPTFIKLWDINSNSEAGNHAVLYVQDNNKKFLFDPNGVIDDTCGLLYMNHITGKNGFTSAEFTTNYKVETPLEPGIQTTAPFKLLGKTNYISDGGYCMFYIKQALDYLEKCKSFGMDLVIEAKKLSTPSFYNSQLSPFGISDDIETMSVSLVKKQFGAGRNKKYKSKKIKK